MFIIKELPMDRDETDENFSPDDPENVFIPESLGPVAYELFAPIAFRIKKADSLPIIVDCLEFLQTVQNYHAHFLTTERRFEREILPNIIKLLITNRREKLNHMELRITNICCLILIKLEFESSEANLDLIKNIKNLCLQVNRFINNADTSDLIKEVKHNLSATEQKFCAEI